MARPKKADTEAAAEFEEKYDVPAGNAERIIQAARDRYPKELRRANLSRVDPVATEALDLKKVQSAVKDGEVKSAAVRGDYVVAVVAGEDGRTHKVALDRDKVGPTEKQVEKAAKG